MAMSFIEQLDRGGIEHLWIAYTDYHGRLAGRAVPRRRFATVAARGTNFAKANFNYTIRDEQAPNPRFAADGGDEFPVPDPASLRLVPFHPATALAFATLYEEDGTVWPGCPRSVLARAVAALAEAGLAATVAFEPEFYLFRDTHLDPATAAGMYTLAGLDAVMPFAQRLDTALAAMDVEVEQIGKEYGRGQFEVNIAPSDPVSAADALLLVKLAARAVARADALVASFMPKPDAALPGCGLHVHLSLRDARTGEDRTVDPSHPSGLAEPARRFLAGWLTHAAGLTALGAPTPNSFKRLQPASWAPAHVYWGIGNRSALVRVPGGGERARLEFRAADNTANPYLFLGGLLWAGLDGLDRALEPPLPLDADAGRLTPAERAARDLRELPRTADAALDALEADAALAAGLGPLIHGEFLRVKRAELASYHLQVHEWERSSYLEAP